MKLVAKTRHKVKVHKAYDTARTPHQRLLEAGVLTETKRQELAVMYNDTGEKQGIGLQFDMLTLS